MSARDNILFYDALDLSRYNKVISACALNQDFRSFSNGHHTNIGEKVFFIFGDIAIRI